MQDTSFFTNALSEWNVTLTDKQIKDFIRYYELLFEWNQFMNLTAITEFDEVFLKHFLDSLSLVKAYDVQKESTVIDVGTGAGFPGLALKIAYPDLKVTLLDSLNKRINFLNTVIDTLQLKDVTTVHGRAEDFAKPGKLRESFDLCVSRAVANLATLSEYCLPYVKEGGKFISYKSEKIGEELKTAQKAITLLGGSVSNQIDFYLPNSDIYRNLVVIEKISKTPGKFPRKAGVAAKEPLV